MCSFLTVYQYYGKFISPHTNEFFNQGSFICQSRGTATDNQMLHLLKDKKVSKRRWEMNSVTMAHAVKSALKYHHIIYQTTYIFRVLNKCLCMFDKEIKIMK